MRINILETNRIKEDLEREISQRNYTSLRYVLFDKSSKLPHATHLYYENNNYYIENRDERGELIGNPYIFEDFSKAKSCFFEVLGEVVALNKYYNNTFGEVPYDSPLWSKSSKDDNKLIQELHKVFDSEKTKNDNLKVWLKDAVKVKIIENSTRILKTSNLKKMKTDACEVRIHGYMPTKLESRDIYKIPTLKGNVSGNEVACGGNKKHSYCSHSNQMTEKEIAEKGILKKGVGNFTFTTSQHL